ncbi:hypothetical protein HYPGJ_10355 [Hyphomicrobium sp. GJ21]|nr:hypothetical protein HYPGJ_10355 [Hyphomicrobium sp. GJ21]
MICQNTQVEAPRLFQFISNGRESLESHQCPESQIGPDWEYPTPVREGEAKGFVYVFAGGQKSCGE